MVPNSRRAGSALIVAVVVIMLIFGVTAAIVAASNNDANAVTRRQAAAKAEQYAESGISVALAELNKQQDISGDGAIGCVTRDGGAQAGEQVTVVLRDSAGAPYTYVSTGPFPDALVLDVSAEAGLKKGVYDPIYSARRRYSVTLKKVNPFSVNDAAMALVGQPNSTEVSLNKTVLTANGNDHTNPPGPGVPGLGIEGAATFASIAPSFAGTNVTGAVNGTPVTGPQAITTPPIDWTSMAAAANAAASWANSLAAANASNNGTYNAATKTWTLGTSPSSVTVLNNPTPFASTTVNGQGTLIVYGSTQINASNFNFNGTIIVLGGTSDGGNGQTTLKMANSTVNVTGGVFAIAQNNQEAEIKLSTSTATVNGPLLAVGTGTSGEVELESETGASKLTVNGYLGLFGNELEAEFKQGTLAVNGSMVMGVPPRDANTSMELELSQATATINYNSAQRSAALATISQFLSNAPTAPPTYAVSAQRELPAK